MLKMNSCTFCCLYKKENITKSVNSRTKKKPASSCFKKLSCLARRMCFIICLLSYDGLFCADQYTLLATIGSGDSTNSSALVFVDQTTGTFFSVIGSVGYIVNGIAYDPTTQKIYATTSMNDPTFNGLIEINPWTGEGTPIGMPFAEALTCLTCDANGQLYAWWDDNVDRLVAINKVDGSWSTVGVDPGIGTGILGLDFNSLGSLYLFNWNSAIFAIDTLTGVATMVGSYMNPKGNHYLHHGKFHPGTGLFWGLSSSIGNGNPIISIVQGDGTYVGSLPIYQPYHTLLFVPASFIPNPGPPSPPIHIDLSARQKKNSYFIAADCYNILEWTNNFVSTGVTEYRIYRSDALIGAVSGSVFRFEDHNRPVGCNQSYLVQAVYTDGSLANSNLIQIKN